MRSMNYIGWTSWTVCTLGALSLSGTLACTSDSRDGSNDTGAATTMTADGGVTASGDGGETGAEDDGGKLDTNANGDGGNNCSDGSCSGKIDILFVIDNSGSMGEEQINLAANFPLLIEQLETLEDDNGNPLGADVNMMVTTTDFGNPECDDFKQHEPEAGAPIVTGCNARISRFTPLDTSQPSIPTACTDVCEEDVIPSGAPFIHFDASGNNNLAPQLPDKDINGDGTPDGLVAQGLACIGMQGVNGCGYESPLESMMQALNPSKAWNASTAPFLRDDALLAIVMITDEADCSVKDYAIMNDLSFQETQPGMGQRPSSAICWNAGVQCDGPTGGEYTNCVSTDDGNMQPTSRYVDYLHYLRDDLNKPVVMLGILGVPEVTAHADEPPYEPIAGGVLDLVIRDWMDGVYPAGDILPADDAAGKDAAYKEWEFGVGPGCTNVDNGQAVPPVRVREVCESLNEGDEIRCCIESICGDDFSAAITCLSGAIQTAIVPAG